MAAEKILIIDDNQSHIKLEKLALAANGYNIRTANNAEEAMQVLGEFNPQLILMDVQLPEINGLELTHKIKADPRYHDILIVAITAYGMKGDKEIALEAGCDGYISKPIDIRAFPQLIAAFLNKKVTEKK